GRVPGALRSTASRSGERTGVTTPDKTGPPEATVALERDAACAGVAPALLLLGNFHRRGVPGATGTGQPLTLCLVRLVAREQEQREAGLGHLGPSGDHAEPLHALPRRRLRSR